MIPKKIHYCWFGNKELPETAKACIRSWKKYMPDYEIIQWDESNYDYKKYEYTKKAYEDQKWAFLVDCARLDIIYQHGGIYFDTDVEVIKNFDNILEQGAYMAFENDKMINTGLGFAAEPGNSFVKENLDYYINIKITKDFEYCTCPLITSELLKKHGLIANGSLQKIMNLTLYPSCYFAPLDFYTRQLNLTENSYSIHHYGMSWLNERDRYWHGIEARLSSKIGRYLAHIVIRVAKFPKGFVQGIITDGVHLTIHKYMNKLKNNIG